MTSIDSLALCEDPVVNMLHGRLKANILQVPEERYQPLAVLAAADDYARFIGAIHPLIHGHVPSLPPVALSPFAELSGTKTTSVKLSLGLKILERYLQPIGASSTG